MPPRKENTGKSSTIRECITKTMPRHEQIFNDELHIERVRELLLNDYSDVIELRMILDSFVKWHSKYFSCTKISSYRVAKILKHDYSDEFQLIKQDEVSETTKWLQFIEDKIGKKPFHTARMSLTYWLKSHAATEESILKWYEDYENHRTIRKNRKLERLANCDTTASNF